MNDYEKRQKRQKAFLKDRFGLFIHWGIYSIPARGEWVRYFERITKEDYKKYFDEFNPINYDPKEWAKIAKRAGMKYAVITAKHHDGFCLFDSKYTTYKAKRDLIKEFVDAFRAEGIKIGFYYSLIDWDHDDYPHYGDQNHPMRDNEAFKDYKYNFPVYLEYMRNQVKELLTNYGKIDIMWFDYSYAHMVGEVWESTKLMEMVRSIQPDIVVNNRLTGTGNTRDEYPDDNIPVYAGDFYSPEQYIPSLPIVDSKGRQEAWEVCLTLNNTWGYSSKDTIYKTPKRIINALIECVSNNGNLLLNVGPNAKGEFPKQAIEILDELGRWMDDNSKSIYGCGKAVLGRPDFGRYTQKDNLLYAHIFNLANSSIKIEGMRGKVKRARLLSDGSELSIKLPDKYPNDAFVNLGSEDIITTDICLLDDIDTVIEIELDL